jgi:hydrogenase expression/formation protein HypE
MRADRILMSHGSGGTMMRELIEDVFMGRFTDPALLRMDDAATLDIPTGARIAMSTDTYVVQPVFFPGGDIGRLAVCGTVNDIATSGATPLYLTVGFVLEEGFPVADLRRVVETMATSAEEAGVRIVTGDTKVVDRGHGDGVYINTAGVGWLADGVDLSASYCVAGDKVLLSGTLGDHGIAVISVREGLTFGTDVVTDAAPLNKMVADVLAAAPGVRCFRDPTRGGLSSTLNELATASGVSITVDETAVPVHDQVRGASEMLGYDVFQVANEGKMVAVVPAAEADAALEAMRNAPYGEDAAIVGEIAAGPAGKVYVATGFGARRIMDMLVGEQLPRIC